MHAQQQRLNQEFMERSPLHASLWHALYEVVPHWNPRITRRFIQTLIPIWREDLMAQKAQLRYLQIAMRLGWFDEAASARKWTLFIDLLEALPTQPSLSTSLNLFNFIAALPTLPPSLQLDTYLSDRLCAPERPFEVADAALLGDCIHHVLCGDYATDGSIDTPAGVKHEHYFHLFEKKTYSDHGKRWIEHPWGAHGLFPLALIDPFGKDPWALVSTLGVDLAGRLVAYDLPQDRHTPIDTDHIALFEPQLRSSEPVWERDPSLQTSLPSPCPSLLRDLLVLSPNLVAGITLTGHVALFERS